MAAPQAVGVTEAKKAAIGRCKLGHGLDPLSAMIHEFIPASRDALDPSMLLHMVQRSRR
jgi:hypothetical protein